MISNLFNYILNKFLRLNSIGGQIISNLFSVILSLFVIGSTAKAVTFTSGLESGINYQNFLIIGELAFLLPTSLMEKYLTTLKDFRSNDFYQTLVCLGISPTIFILKKASNELFFPLLRIVAMIILSFFFLNLEINTRFLTFFLSTQVLGIALYIGPALVIGEVFLLTGGGLRSMMNFNSLLAICSGIYFPVSVFPKGISVVISEYIPQALMLNLCRNSISQVATSELWPIFIKMISEIVFILITSWFLYRIFKRLNFVNYRN